MKKLIALLAACAFALTGYSQTEVSPQQGFFDSVLKYFTAFDTNLSTFHADQDSFDLMSGAENQQGVGITAVLGGRYNFVRTDKGMMFGLGAYMRNADVAGTILSEQGEVSLSKIKFDTKLTIGTGAGYSREFKSGYVPLFFEVDKALTENTFSGIRISHDFYFKDKNQIDTPKIWLVFGATF